MRIENLVECKTDIGKRIAATVHWEDCSRPSQDIFFETVHGYGDWLTCSPHPFLVACLVPAMQWGERRLAIDHALCPELVEGLITVMAYFQTWDGPQKKPIPIEGRGSRLPEKHKAAYEGGFLSGGVDSLAMLRLNRMRYPPEHPHAFQACLMVHGFDTGHTDPLTEGDVFQRNLEAAASAALDAGVELIPVVTNIRTLDHCVDFWMDKFCAAGLAAVGHAFAARFSAVAIASSYDIPNLVKVCSHPLIDPNYSSADLRIRHDDVRLSRLDKLRVVAGWPAALENMRVCTANDPVLLNCGRCEKCIRTMTMLLALEKLAQSPAFPNQDVSPELLDTITITYPYQDLNFQEVLPLLARLGRTDLVQVIEAKSADFHRRQKWQEEKDWKGFVKRFDRKWLGSTLYHSYRGLRHGRQEATGG